MFYGRILKGCWDEGTITIRDMPRSFVLSSRKLCVFEVDEYEELVKLVKELNSSNNTLYRLLASCVILLDDGDVTKRAVEKQIRYNEAALAKARK